MRKILLFLLFMLIVSGSLFATGQAEDEIKIGFIGPLTGDYANYGKLMTQAVKIAVEEWNATGGIGGKKIVLIAEDSEGKVDKANAAIEKLASVDRIYGLVGCVFSSSSLAVAPRCNEEQIVMISPSSTHKDLTDIGDYIFRDVVSDGLQATVFAKYVAQEMGLKNVAILYTKNDYSQGLAEGFKEVFEAEGGKIVAMETALQGDKDFKTQLTKIKDLGPQGLFIPNYVAEIAQILDQAKQLGIEAQILSADGFSNPEVLDLAGKLANGVIFSGPAEEDSSENNSLKTAFESQYKSQWGEAPDSFSLNSYDGANLILDAIEYALKKSSTGEIDRSLIQEYLAKVSGYQGVSGDITFAANGDVIKNQGILTVVNQEYKQLSIYTVDKDEKLVKVK